MSEVNCRCNIATGLYVIGCPEHPAFLPGGESTSAQLRRVEQERDDLIGLLSYVLHLRQHGERAPGGDETWAEFDRRAEAFLRGLGASPRPAVVEEQHNQLRADLAAAVQQRDHLSSQARELLAERNEARAALAATEWQRDGWANTADLARAEASSARYERDQVLKRAIRAETELDLLRTQLQQGDKTP